MARPNLWSDIPAVPGVYRMLDRTGRVLYLGRSSNLRRRVRSYWGDLRDRPHLRRMISGVARVEFEVCESEHHAALLEREMLEERIPRFNRVVGYESQVWIRLCLNPAAPSLTVVHEVEAGHQAEHFGPYLGWAAADEATKGMLRVFPISLACTKPKRAIRELARARGVTPADLGRFGAAIKSILQFDPRAVEHCIRTLTDLRDQHASNLMFEAAQAIHGQIDAIQWITQQRSLA